MFSVENVIIFSSNFFLLLDFALTRIRCQELAKSEKNVVKALIYFNLSSFFKISSYAIGGSMQWATAFTSI